MFTAKNSKKRKQNKKIEDNFLYWCNFAPQFSGQRACVCAPLKWLKKNYTKKFVLFSKIMNNIQLQSNNNKEMKENLMQILTQTNKQTKYWKK